MHNVCSTTKSQPAVREAYRAMVDRTGNLPSLPGAFPTGWPRWCRALWFALGEDRPLLAFAGLWRPWAGVRGTKVDPAEGEHELFAFLTCEPNAVVGPIHPKAMPIVLTTPAECDACPM